MSQPNPTPFAYDPARSNCPDGQCLFAAPGQPEQPQRPDCTRPHPELEPSEEGYETEVSGPDPEEPAARNARRTRRRIPAHGKRLVPEGEATRPPPNATQR